MACGCKLGSSLVFPPAPPRPRVVPDTVSGRFVINALLWTAPTYNAYSVGLIDGRLGSHTVIEQPLTLGDPLARMFEIAGKNGHSPAGVYKTLKPQLPDPTSIQVMSLVSERFGVMKPVDYGVESDCAYIVFDQIQGLPVAHLDQMGEKEARCVGLQLCEIAGKFHELGWIHNGFEPYSVVLDHDNKVRVLGFDRARPKGSRTDGMPIYPSRGYTAPELFDEDAVYDPRADVYSIGALLQFLLTGERLDSGDGATIYPVATVVPGFERLLARALADDPDSRFQTIAELRQALTDLTLPVVLQSGHFTDVGLIRELNEDSILALNLTQY